LRVTLVALLVLRSENMANYLDIDQVKKGDTVEVYRIDQGFIDVKISRVSRVKRYIKTIYPDGFWEIHWDFWVPGSHQIKKDDIVTLVNDNHDLSGDTDLVLPKGTKCTVVEQEIVSGRVGYFVQPEGLDLFIFVSEDEINA
jgi:hypothetical protein